MKNRRDVYLYVISSDSARTIVLHLILLSFKHYFRIKQNFILKIEETEHSMNRCYHPGNQNIDAD